MRRMTVEEFIWALNEIREDGVYLKRMKELDAKIETLRQYTEIADTVEKALALEQRVKQDAQKNEVLEKQLRSQYDEMVVKFQKEKQALESEIQQRLNSVQKKATEVRSEHETVSKQKVSLEQLEARLNKKQEELVSRELNLQSRERALVDRLNRIKEAATS